MVRHKVLNLIVEDSWRGAAVSALFHRFAKGRYDVVYCQYTNNHLLAVDALKNRICEARRLNADPASERTIIVYSRDVSYPEIRGDVTVFDNSYFNWPELSAISWIRKHGSLEALPGTTLRHMVLADDGSLLDRDMILLHKELGADELEYLISSYVRDHPRRFDIGLRQAYDEIYREEPHGEGKEVRPDDAS